MERLSKEQSALISASVPLNDGRKVVLLNVGGRKDVPAAIHNCNIYCIDASGSIIWQVQAEGVINERDSFVSITLAEPGSLRATRFFGNEFTIRTDTGVATHVGWHK